MKKIPYSLQGLIFAPALIGVIFILKVTCPAATGEWCFADNFVRPTFMPLKFLYQVFGTNHAPLLANHEPLFILGYWAIVGFLVGLLLELYIHMKKPSLEEGFKESLY